MKKFVCEQCNENAPMFHTGTDCATGEWKVLAVVNADGSVLFENVTDIETENLRAFCGVCGMEINGATFCDIAWPIRTKWDVTGGYSYRVQNLRVGEMFVFPSKDRNNIAGIVTTKQQRNKGKWKIKVERGSSVGTCTRVD